MLSDEWAAVRAAIADLEAELTNAHLDQLADAHRRATLYADQLLSCALSITGFGGGDGRSSLDVALDIVRDRAHVHGLRQRRGPHPVSGNGPQS